MVLPGITALRERRKSGKTATSVSTGAYADCCSYYEMSMYKGNGRMGGCDHRLLWIGYCADCALEGSESREA